MLRPLRKPPVWTARSRAADLEPAEFERVLGLGLGRAILFLRGHEAAPHRAAILRACSQHTAYDPQVEGSRAAYLFEVLQATGDPTAYLDEILTALLAVTDYWDADQLFDLARCFAQAGHAHAREAMYEKFLRNDVEEPFVGAAALVRLDGLRGLLVVAEHVGRTVRADPAAWIDQSLLAVANEVCGKEQVRETLEQARAASPEIAAFIDALEANRAERAEAVRHRLDLTGASYERVREVIASQPSRQLGLVVLQRWGRAASDEELARAAADLLAESDEDRLISYLRIFGKRRFPLDPAPLLPLVPHANTRLVAAAFTALSHLSDARVRQVALDLLQDEQVTGWARGRAADLLVANYLPGDAERLAGWLTRSRDRDE